MGSWSIWRVKQKSFVVLVVWKKGIMQLPKKQRSKRVTTTAYREKRVKLLSRVVTKHQLPEPSPQGGK